MNGSNLGARFFSPEPNPRPERKSKLKSKLSRRMKRYHQEIMSSISKNLECINGANDTLFTVQNARVDVVVEDMEIAADPSS
jgi:hypothetical protein